VKKTLYNLHLLREQPSSPILIVEGEKAADAAKGILPDYIVMSWPGGANAVDKADWRPLKGKRVVIWPDNDGPGFKAAEQICKELKKVDAKEIRLVSPEMLKNKFPEKWDLADSFPGSITKKDLVSYLKRADRIDRGYVALFEKIYPQELQRQLFIEKARFFHRMQFFENLLGRDCLAKNGLEDPVYLAYQEFMNRRDQVKQHVYQLLGLQGAIAEKVSDLANVFRATQNRMPLKEEMKDMLDVIRQIENESSFARIVRFSGSDKMTAEVHDFVKEVVAEKISGVTLGNLYKRQPSISNLLKEVSGGLFCQHEIRQDFTWQKEPISNEPSRSNTIVR